MRTHAITVCLPDGHVQRFWLSTAMSAPSVWSKIQKGDELPLADERNGATFLTSLNHRYVVHVSEQT